jgi:alkylhydroperoxidase/carboxymuconolactone decarboxylase family protein YurZ
MASGRHGGHPGGPPGTVGRRRSSVDRHASPGATPGGLGLGVQVAAGGIEFAHGEQVRPIPPAYFQGITRWHESCSTRGWENMAMQRELEAVASAMARADFDLLPAAVRRAYQAGATVDQVRAAIGVGCCLGEVPPNVRALAWESANVWAGSDRRSPVA